MFIYWVTFGLVRTLRNCLWVPLPRQIFPVSIQGDSVSAILSSPLPSEGWDCRHVPPYPVSHAFLEAGSLMALHTMVSELWSGNYVNLS